MAEETDKQEQPKRRKLVKVTVLAREGKSALVQWADGNVRRGYIPAAEIEDDKAAKDVLKAALPYGVSWGAFVDFSRLTPEAFETRLHDAGIWEIADLEKQPGAVSRVVNALTITAGELHTKARQHTED
jgi:ribosomal protein S1